METTIYHESTDNHTRTFDKIQQAGVLVSRISESTELNPVAFVKNIQNFKKIREIKAEVNFFTVLGELFSVISNLQGVKGEIEQINKVDISRLLLQVHSDLSLEEIYKAFELERFGVIGLKTEHFQLFNADYVKAVLVKYKNWRQNTRVQHNLKTEPLTKNLLPEISEIEKKEILRKGVIERFEHYLKTKEINEPFVHIFDFLLEQGIIKGANTPKLIQYYEEIREKARLELRNEVREKKSISKSERNAIKVDFAKITDGTSEKIDIRAKRIVLMYFFNNVVVNQKDIKKIIYENT